MRAGLVTLQGLARQAQSSLRSGPASDFLTTSTGNLTIAFLSALGGILAARLLGPEGRGELAAAIVWASILGTVAQVGLPQALTYFTAAESAAVGAIFRAMLLLCAMQSLAILLIGWIAAQLILPKAEPNVVDAVQIYLLSIPLSTAVTYMATIAQGARRFKVFRALRVMPAVVYVLVFVFAYLFGVRESRQVLYLLLLGQLLVALWAFWFFYHRVHPIGFFEWPWVPKLLRYGLQSYPASLSWMANARIDQFIMSALVSVESLGQYAVAVSYAGVVFPLLGAVPMVLFPHIARGSRETAGPKIMVGLGVSVLVALAAAIVLAAISRYAIPLLFGAQFNPAVLPAVILLAGTIVLGANYVLSDGLRGLGRPLIPSIGEFVGLLITILALFLLLPRLGMLGAAWASVLSYTVTFLILATSTCRVLRKPANL